MSFILQYHRLFKVLVQQAGSNIVLPGISFAPAAGSRKCWPIITLPFARGKAGSTYTTV